ncbi:MAG: hypothetical protein ABSF48_07780 [Thermodesulfobacteriota bacterium]|jgi:hypothetical protein
MMKKCFPFIALFVVGLFFVACSRDKGPAEAAIKAAEEALNATKAEASKYVPDQVKSVEDALKAAKDSFAKGEYTAALNSAKDLPAKAKDLDSAAAAKKAELAKSWEEMSGSVPKMVEDIKAKLDALEKSKRLPKGMEKAKLEGAKAGLAEITQGWTDADNAFKAGNLTDALTKAKTVKEKATGIMTSLGMQA